MGKGNDMVIPLVDVGTGDGVSNGSSSVGWFTWHIKVGIPGDLLTFFTIRFWLDLSTGPPPAWSMGDVGICTRFPSP